MSRQLKMLQHNLRRVMRLLERDPEAYEPEAEDIELDPFSPEAIAANAEAAQATGAPAIAKKGRAAIIGWDLGHNPAGRAIVLYDLLERDWDVELIGPVWSKFGGKVWPPIANSKRNIRTLVCNTLEEFYPAATAFAETHQYDLVIVSKPRLPSMALGAMIKKNSACPMVLDIDDLELSFTDKTEPVDKETFSKDLVAALTEPYESLATRYCDNLIADCDALTVSNITLRQRYGGHMVRHARDETVFNASNFDREKAREKLGLKDSDFSLMFVGTPRPHKGIYQVAEALHELDDQDFVFTIVGNIDYPGMQEKLESFDKARIEFLPNCDFEELPQYLAAADAVPLLQDTTNEIAQYQIPAKISDATAFGLPVITTEVPPVFDLESQGIVKVIHGDYLGDTLQDLYDARSSKDYEKQKAQIRTGFEDEFGFNVNRSRLNNAIRAAQNAPVELSGNLQDLLDMVQKAYLEMGQKPPKIRKPRTTKKDLVMFWKQNDSGLFGRRSDMIMKHLIKADHFGRILQFDAPLNLEDLAKLAEKSERPYAAAGLTATNAVRNKYKMNDTDRHFLRTFIWSDSFRNSTLIDGTSLDVYPAYVREQMEALDFDPDNTIAWVCPVVHDFPKIAKEISFSGIVSDIIDDQRAFDLTPAQRRRVEKNYEDILPVSDMVLTNCQPNVEAFTPLCGEIHFVPNGTELLPEELSMPELLTDIPRPIAGYVGNLQDRIDWDLLDEAAHHVPDISFVIAGGGAKQENIDRLNKRDNVHFIGVVPYEKVQAYIKHFDVCIVPHKGTDLTKRMNPLKVYNYFAAHKPIVTTEVENIDGTMNPYIRFARNAGELAVFIKESAETPMVVDERYKEVLSEITWDSRINHIHKIYTETFKPKRKSRKKTPTRSEEE